MGHPPTPSSASSGRTDNGGRITTTGGNSGNRAATPAPPLTPAPGSVPDRPSSSGPHQSTLTAAAARGQPDGLSTLAAVSSSAMSLGYPADSDGSGAAFRSSHHSHQAHPHDVYFSLAQPAPLRQQHQHGNPQYPQQPQRHPMPSASQHAHEYLSSGPGRPDPSSSSFLGQEYAYPGFWNHPSTGATTASTGGGDPVERPSSTSHHHHHHHSHSAPPHQSLHQHQQHHQPWPSLPRPHAVSPYGGGGGARRPSRGGEDGAASSHQQQQQHQPDGI